jgi:hypothetical protein
MEKEEMRMSNRHDVAQISNLLYRRASSLPAAISARACWLNRMGCRLEIGDTANWESALR